MVFRKAFFLGVPALLANGDKVPVVDTPPTVETKTPEMQVVTDELEKISEVLDGVIPEDGGTNSTAKNRTIKESIMANLTFSFVGEIYDPITFSARSTGGDIKKARVVRLGNVMPIGDPERAIRALKRKISKSAMVLTRDAPESHQYFSAAERARHHEAQEARRKAEQRRQIRAELEADGILESAPVEDNAVQEEKVDDSLGDPEVGLNGIWRNITVVDAWSFDGTHLAKTLASDFPKLFKFEEQPYVMDEDVRRAMEVEELEEAMEVPVNTASSNYHILQARGAIRKAQAFKKVSKLMAEIGQESAEGKAAAETLGVKTGKKSKTSKKKEEEEADEIPQYLALALVFIFALGGYTNFGRGRKKGKAKPSKDFIEAEKIVLEAEKMAKTAANPRQRANIEKEPEYRSYNY